MRLLIVIALTMLGTASLAEANRGLELPAELATKLSAGEEIRLRINPSAQAGGSCYSPPGQNCYLSYDWGYRRYVCVCYNNDNGGGGS